MVPNSGTSSLDPTQLKGVVSGDAFASETGIQIIL
jgi:hypothetical protein